MASSEPEFVAQDRKDIDGDKAGMGARLVGADLGADLAAQKRAAWP